MAEIAQTAANVRPGTNVYIDAGTAGEDISAGMPVYRDTGTLLYMKSRANTPGTLAYCDGIAINSASLNQPISIQKSGSINIGAALTIGKFYGVSADTAGKIFDAPDTDYASTDWPIGLGVAKSATELVLAIAVPRAEKA